MAKWYLACCDSSGRCFGFLRKDRSVDENPNPNVANLVSFKTKSESNELCMQINLSHSLMPNGYQFRVTPVKGD